MIDAGLAFPRDEHLGVDLATLWEERSELAWAEAARLAGVADPAAMGERVRRKLKRLGTEYNRRLVQAGRG